MRISHLEMKAITAGLNAEEVKSRDWRVEICKSLGGGEDTRS